MHGEHGLVWVVVDCRGTGDVDSDSHNVICFVADALSIRLFAGIGLVGVSGCLYSDTYYVGIDSLHISPEKFGALVYGVEQEINRSHYGSLGTGIAYKYMRGSISTTQNVDNTTA